MAELEKSTTFLNEQAQRQSILRAFNRHPVRSAVVIVILDFMLVIVLTQAAKSLFAASPPDLPVLSLVALVTVLALSLLRWWQVAGFNPPDHWRNLNLLVLPALVVALLPLFRGVTLLPPASPFYALLVAALIGFHEEVVYRGIILRLLRSEGLVRAVVLSSLMFGLAYAWTLFVTDQPLLVLVQMVCAAAEGVGLAALRIRTHTLWFLILLRAVQTLLLLYTALPLVFVIIAQSAILFIYGMLILRSRLQKEQVSRLE